MIRVEVEAFGWSTPEACYVCTVTWRHPDTGQLWWAQGRGHTEEFARDSARYAAAHFIGSRDFEWVENLEPSPWEPERLLVKARAASDI